MKWIMRYCQSLAPLIFIGGVVFLSEQLFSALNCTSYGKELNPCFAIGVDIKPFLLLGMFWFKYLIPVAWFISAPWFIYLIISHIESIIKGRRSQAIDRE
jgi:hypothetical protein